MSRFDTKLAQLGRASAAREGSVSPPPAVPQARRLSDHEPDRGRLERLPIGFEDPDGLIADLSQALVRP